LSGPLVNKSYQSQKTYNKISQEIWKQCSYTIYCIGKLVLTSTNPKQDARG
jgi:hypothetical protein